MSTTFTMSSSDTATSLDDAVKLPADMKCTQARDLLMSYRFTQAPVMDDNRLIGWVRTSHLVGRSIVRQRTTQLDRCAILARESPVEATIKTVAEHGLVFLAGPTGITEFAVSSDLDRHAVRCYLYVLLSELEMLMADRVEASAMPTEEIERLFDRRDKKRFEAAREADLEIRTVDYLVFSAYEKLAPRIPEIVACFPGPEEDLVGTLTDLRTMRNCVAHPAQALTVKFLPEEISTLMVIAERFVDRLRAVEVPTSAA